MGDASGHNILHIEVDDPTCKRCGKVYEPWLASPMVPSLFCSDECRVRYIGVRDATTNPFDEVAPPLDLKAELVNTDGLDNIPEPEPLINGVLDRATLAWLVGPPGSAKSFIALDMAGCVGGGLPWQDYPVPTDDIVLYVVAEGVSGLRRRVRAWEKVNDIPMHWVSWLPLPVQATSRDWSQLVELARELEPALIVIDTQSRMTIGLEENSAKDMGVWVQNLDRLRLASGACVLVVHHQGRSGDHMRGSSAMDGAADTILKVSKDDDLICIKNTKQKNAAESDEILLRLVPTDDSAVLTASAGLVRKATETAALKMAIQWWDLFRDDQVSATKLADAIETSRATFFRHLRVLLNEHYAAKETAGRSTYYRLLRDPGPDDD